MSEDPLCGERWILWASVLWRNSFIEFDRSLLGRGELSLGLISRGELLRPESPRPASFPWLKSGRPFGVIRNERVVEGLPLSRVDRLEVDGRGEGRCVWMLREGLLLRCGGEMFRDGEELLREEGELLRCGGEILLDGDELLRCEGEFEREREELLPDWILFDGDLDGALDGDEDGRPWERAEFPEREGELADRSPPDLLAPESLPERELPRRCANVSLPIHTSVEARAIIAMPLM